MQSMTTDSLTIEPVTDIIQEELLQENNNVIHKFSDLNVIAPFSLSCNRIVTHSANAGLNPLADAAASLFSILGKLKQLPVYRQLSKLQKELIQEVNSFHETISQLNYNAEYIAVCRYIICATIDDIIANTPWGGQNQWDHYSLLTAFNQDTQHQDKFFIILERAIKEQTLYIDLMELMYISLSFGYKGQYRSTEYSQYQLEQITHQLYKHIQVYRGNFSRTLSPTPIKNSVIKNQKLAKKNKFSPLLAILITAYIILIIFVSLDFLTDVISNEAYQPIAEVKNLVSHST